MPAIAAENLTRTFDDFTAVDHVSFTVGEGELFGLLGPNGAGKTTTVNLLATLLKPTAGRAMVAGHDVLKERDAVRRAIGIVFQEPALDGKLTGRENLHFHGLMYGFKGADLRRRADEVLGLVGLGGWADKYAETYSGGMKRRLEIARGLMHRPRVMYLDEPTLGLDTQTRRSIWDYIRELKKAGGTTFILTTHYMEEADILCDRILIMDRGRVAALDTPARLKDVLGGDVVNLDVERPEALAAAAKKHDWVRAATISNSTLCLTVEKGETRIPELFTIARELGVSITSVSLRKPSLEDVFLHYTGKTLRDAEASAGDRLKTAMMSHYGRRR
jgi:ABC-2 type transport system ATP-binding protein